MCPHEKNTRAARPKLAQGTAQGILAVLRADRAACAARGGQRLRQGAAPPRNPFADDPLFRRCPACIGGVGTVGEAGRRLGRDGRSVRASSSPTCTSSRAPTGSRYRWPDKREVETRRSSLKDSRSDLAVLRLKDAHEKFATLDFANSDELMVSVVNMISEGQSLHGVGQTVTAKMSKLGARRSASPIISSSSRPTPPSVLLFRGGAAGRHDRKARRHQHRDQWGLRQFAGKGLRDPLPAWCAWSWPPPRWAARRWGVHGEGGSGAEAPSSPGLEGRSPTVALVHWRSVRQGPARRREEEKPDHLHRRPCFRRSQWFRIPLCDPSARRHLAETDVQRAGWLGGSWRCRGTSFPTAAATRSPCTPPRRPKKKRSPTSRRRGGRGCIWIPSTQGVVVTEIADDSDRRQCRLPSGAISS